MQRRTMQREADREDVADMTFEDAHVVHRDVLVSDVQMDSGFRGISDADFNLATMSQEVPSTFENTTFRSAPMVAMDAQPHVPESVQRLKDLPKPSFVPLSVTPMKPELQIASAAPSAAARPLGTEADLDLAEQVVVGPVPPLPYELEPVTVIRKNFPSSATAASAVIGALREGGVDFTAEPESAKWRCAQCCAAACVVFTVQLYLAAGEYVIEIQRRSGEGFAFMAIYRQIKGYLTGKAVKSRPANFGLLSPSLPPSLLALVSEPEPNAVEEVSLPINLLESEYLDTQKEGIRCLSEMASDLSTRDRIASSSDALGMTLRSVGNFLAAAVEVEQRSFAVFTLANLTEAAPCKDMLTTTQDLYHILHTLAGFVQNGSYEDAQMRREAARCLANLATTHGEAMVRVLGEDLVRDFVVGTSELHDPVVRDYVSSACGNFSLETKA